MIHPEALQQWRMAFKSEQRITVLTGAGISAESGIPTFRGPEGYWTIGSREYHPQEMATLGMFQKQPLEVWRWYCYRRAVCLSATPNAGHRALVDLERMLGDRFTLITQNVDGLHLRAGNSETRTFQIHGNINYLRCARACSPAVYPIPDFIPSQPISKALPEHLLQKLVCPACGGLARPHVLWFDESYDEEHYRFESSLQTAANTDLLLVVGTSGATTLPNHVVQLVIRQGGLVIDINLEANPFSELAGRNRGFSLIGPAGTVLPALLAAVR